LRHQTIPNTLNNVNNTVLYLKTGTEFEVLETIDMIIDVIA